LKQTPRAWYSRLSDKLQPLGFSPSKADISLFYYKKGLVTFFLLVYVDDIIVASSSLSAATDLLHNLQSEFALKDLGTLHYFLGIEVSHAKEGLYLSQKKYTTDVLQRVGMLSCKSASTPLSCSMKISSHVDDQLNPEDATWYHSIVSAL
jgi:hypothetical protein